jgi:AAA+ ATPase superfamily predicted ATPase
MLGKTVFETIGTRSQRLMKLMVTTLKTLNGHFGYDPVSNTPTFDIRLGDITNPVYTLEEIFACIEQADKRCIIAIDEFQQTVNYAEKNIEALLRTHIQHCSNANFIFSGSERHIMNEMFLDTARPFYNSADMMMLKPIAEDKYLAFVQHHFNAGGKAIDDDAVHTAYQVFEGNTYYLQKTFRTLFSETEAGQDVGKQQVEDVITQMIADNNHRYGEVLSRLTLAQKELLNAVAAEGRARQITSGAFIRRHHLQSASSVQAASKKLLSYGLLSSEDGEYYIDDQLMRQWLLR